MKRMYDATPKRKQAKAMQEYVDVLGERIKDLIDNG